MLTEIFPIWMPVMVHFHWVQLDHLITSVKLKNHHENALGGIYESVGDFPNHNDVYLGSFILMNV